MPPKRRPTPSGAHIVMIGILPTLMPEHLADDWMSESTRYQALNDSIFTARGEDILIDIGGPERLSLQAAHHRPGVGVHQHAVAPAGFAGRVRRQLERRAGAGRARSWRSVPTRRTSSATNCGPRPASNCSRRPPTPGPTSSRPRVCGPRVWFGERWITSIFDLFEENVRYFPSLLPELSDEDPVAELAARAHSRAGRATAAQRHRVPVEPPGLRRGRRAGRTCGWRTGCCPPGPPSST